jgi:ADP-ribose pyrophosphatase
MRTFSLFLIFSFPLCCLLPISMKAGEASRQAYLELIKQHPNLVRFPGDASKGEIEIIVDEQEMADIEKITGIDVGVIQTSKWGWLWINEACKFPDGHEAVFGRIILMKNLDSYAGVAVMPIMPDGKVVLICNFRHASRSWEIELPRGMVDLGEDVEDAAKREAMEETGMLIHSLRCLGKIPPDSGLSSTIVPIFLAKVIDHCSPQHEEGEVIEEILSLTIDEIKQSFLLGYYECAIHGIVQRVPFRDPFLAYAILLYELSKVEPSMQDEI